MQHIFFLVKMQFSMKKIAVPKIISAIDFKLILVFFLIVFNVAKIRYFRPKKYILPIFSLFVKIAFGINSSQI